MSDLKVTPSMVDTMEWRGIGPYRGGRSEAVAGHPIDPMVFYFGSAGGGVWKTEDGGTYWENISDGFFNTASVGAIAISDSDPNVIYVGTGEACLRNTVGHGDGVYKSTDGGKTWSHKGLDDSQHIGRIRIHPQNPDIVFVAVLGHAYGPSEQRGVFRSTDGGDTWEKVLFRSENAGAIDLSLDASNPRNLYATLFEVRRSPWDITTGGPDSGIYKSTDGGDTWTDINDNPGLPEGLKGRIGIAISPPMPERLWALIESKEGGGLYRSDNGGDTWEYICNDTALRLRPFYFGHVFADPQDSETVWVLNITTLKSNDGGRNFTVVETPHVDKHDLWIDPKNPKRLIEGNDGGACISFNGGASFTGTWNQPTAEIYHFATDTQFPYRVVGTQQDSTAISLPNSSVKGWISAEEYYTCGSSESGYVAIRPDNPNIVFSGGPEGMGRLLRYDHSTRQIRNTSVWPEIYEGSGADERKYRFQWTYPIVISPHDPNVLYVTGNHVFRSTDDGTSWQMISPDLTRNDPDKLALPGGPITKDGAAAENYCTIFSFAESPLRSGLLWAGTDDGLVHISQDGGDTWHDVTPEGFPEWATVTSFEPSHYDPASAFFTATRYKLDDYRPLIYKTQDYGNTWQSITEGIPEGDISRVIREDPDRKGLLYAGTESGVFASFDEGLSWHSLQLNLPVVPVHDLVVKNQDLVAGTHGRSFWILDDLTPLHQLTDEVVKAPAHLFEPRPAYRQVMQTNHYEIPDDMYRTPQPGIAYTWSHGVPSTYKEKRNSRGETVREFLDAGTNPPYGLVVSYHLEKSPQSEVTLAFLDSNGQVIADFSSIPKVSISTPARRFSSLSQGQKVSVEAGMNRFVWDLRYPSARKLPGLGGLSNSRIFGITVTPGTYQVCLTVEGETFTRSFEVRKDPNIPVSQEDLEQQFDLLMKIRDKVSETHDAITKLTDVRLQVNEWALRAQGHSASQTVSDAADKVSGKLFDVEDELTQSKAAHPMDKFNVSAQLNAKLAHLNTVVSGNDGVPTLPTYEVVDSLSERIDAQIHRLEEIIENDVPEFINLIHELDIPTILPKDNA